MRLLARLVFITLTIFGGIAYAYPVADSFRFPLDNYSVGCNPYWGTCVKSWHLGEDASAVATTPAKAPANGIVKEARYASGYGGLYVIEHTLIGGERVVSIIGHLNASSFTRKAGDEVRIGDVLGEVGTYAQNGGWTEHVHFAIHKGPYGSGAKCGSEWIYSGYTSCSSTKSEWYVPSDFVRDYNRSTKETSRFTANCRFEYCWKDATVCQNGTNHLITLDGVEPVLFTRMKSISPYDACPKIGDRAKEIADAATRGNIQDTSTDKKNFRQSFWNRALDAVRKFLSIPGASADTITEGNLPMVSRTIAIYEDGHMAIVAGNGIGGDDGSTNNRDPIPETRGSSLNGSTGSGSYNLAATALRTQSGSGSSKTAFHYRDDSICFRATIKNAGSINLPSGDQIMTQFYLSTGNDRDNDGGEAIGKEYSDRTNLNAGVSKNETRCLADADKPEFPGTYNVAACVNADKKLVESTRKDNCKEEVRFTLTSKPDITFAPGSLSVSNLTPNIGTTLSATVLVWNAGDTFETERIRLGWYISGPEYGSEWYFLGFDETKRENLKKGVQKSETLESFVAPKVPGVYTLRVKSDIDNRALEPNEGNNWIDTPITVKDPNAPLPEDPNAPVPCPTITASNWNEWSGSGYAPPFDDLDGNALRITPYCKRDNPYLLSVKFGKPGDPNVRTYQVARVWNGTPTPELVTLHCDDDPNGAPNANGYCEGGASFEMEAQWINTSSTAGPIPIDAYIVYHLGNNVFRYPTPNTYARQGARMP